MPATVKVHLFGKTGWIGSQLLRLMVEKPYEVTCSDSRMEEREQVERELDAVQPKYVIIAAGLTGRPNVDWCDSNQQETIRANVIGLLTVVDLCATRGIHVTYFGTGCIYEYDENHPIGGRGFTEEDAPNFTGSFYSKTKGMVESLLHSYSNVLTLRVRMPISDDLHPRNFITKITNYPKICDVPNAVSVLHDLLPLTFVMMEKGLTGVYNFVNPGVISHSEILALYKSLIDPNHTYQLVNKEVLKTLIKAGRSDNCLDTTKLESALPECQIPHISVSIQDVFTRMKKNVRKNILLTGGAGFIGSHVANFLVERYSFYHVVVVDKITYCSNEKNLDPSANKPNFVFIKADISDAEKMKEIFETYQIDTVMHFAAETLVDNSFNNSNAFTNSNVIGTHTLLHCARHFGVELFLHVSTDEVYGEVKDGIPRKETATLTPTNPYSASKAAAEMLVQSYHHSFHVPVIITRSNNVYGPAQYPEKVIPSFLGNIRAGKTCPIYGHGQHLRNFLYVGDAVEAFDLLLHKGIIGQTYNIGVNNEHTVMSIAKQLHEILGKPMNIEHVKDRPYNDTRYVIDSTKLHLLGWKPKTSWKEGLKKTIEWYLKHGEYYWG